MPLRTWTRLRPAPRSRRRKHERQKRSDRFFLLARRVPTHTLAATLSSRGSPVIRYRCPKCKKALTADDAEAGAKFACPQCGQRLQVPTPTPNKTVLGEIQNGPETAGTE